MKRKALCALAAAVAALLCAALAATPAAADFGLSVFEGRVVNEDGSAATQAGSHPFALETFFEVNYHEKGPGEFFVDGGDIKDLVIEAPRGLIGDATAVPRCTTLEFATLSGGFPACGDKAAIGVTATILDDPVNITSIPAPVYNLTPPPGVPVRIGFVVSDVPVTIDIGLKQAPDYNAVAHVPNIAQILTVFGAATELWGVPADPAHDFLRGHCAPTAFADFSEPIKEGRLNYEKGIPGNEECEAEAPEKPFLVLPRTCSGPLATSYELDSWSEPGVWAKGADPTPALSGCGKDKMPFLPQISAAPTADEAETGSGLDFELDFEDEIDHSGEGLVEPKGIAQSDLKKIAVTLPEGVTINPSVGEGLGVCTPADLDRETISAEPGQGCPNSSKIGTVAVETPLVEETIVGPVFLAQQDDPKTTAPGAENPFDSPIAFYIVLENKNLGVLVKVPAKVEPDPKTGQLITTVDDAPQIPFTRFRFHFREGQRAPLVTPPACGAYTTRAKLTPWARPDEVLTREASFQITRGVGGGPCPPGGIPPFNPGFSAGSLNNNAASYSPFNMRLTRADGEQDMTRFSAILPPGVLGKLAGVGKCAEAQITAAKAKSGREELASPSCPTSSLIGHTLAGAGVGSALTYVGGELYLAGPYKGDPLSVVAVTPAVAGPFDAGTVVVRVALTLDSKTAEVEVDGSASDPIPHILKGIPLKVRDLEVAVDRREFTLNPTSCEPSQTRATLFGSYRDVFSPADDVPVSLTSRHQIANCARLGFKPALEMKLKGGTGRGAHPSLRAVLRARAGDANIEGAVVRLPRSAFLDQAHIRTICTRVQFAAKSCPPGAVYGHVRAFTPLLDEPLEGPVYLRSSNHKLPDLVFDLHGIVDVEASARVDSLHGGIRTSFTAVPDAPVSKVVVDLQGGHKGLIVNSRDLCSRPSKADVQLSAHNGAGLALRPPMQARCG